MISTEARAAFGAALGDAGFETHAPLEIEGQRPSATLRPDSGADLAEALAEASAHGICALVRGAGTRLGMGNVPERADVVLSTERLVGIDELDAEEGVCRARAGTSLAELRAAAREAGWELPLDPPGARTTLGGALAAAALGPRAHGFGPPRDLVLGLEVVLASGARTRCGGRVVKNVTGYDLNKLYTGSFGRLGVIEGAWLRLCPQPETTAVFEAQTNSLAEAGASGLEAARRVTTRAAALHASQPGTAPRFVVELAGDSASVERDATWLRETLGASRAGPEVLDSVRAMQGSEFEPGVARFRISSRGSRLTAALAELATSGASLLAYPGLGLIYASWPLSDESDPSVADAFFSRAAITAARAGGNAVCESAPLWARRGRDVFGGESHAAAPLWRALVERFDPAGILNRGRFAGGL